MVYSSNYFFHNVSRRGNILSHCPSHFQATSTKTQKPNLSGERLCQENRLFLTFCYILTAYLLIYISLDTPCRAIDYYCQENDYYINHFHNHILLTQKLTIYNSLIVIIKKVIRSQDSK